MIEFFINIGKWFLENKDNILLTVTSTEFASLVALALLFLKSIKFIRHNTTASDMLNETIQSHNEMASSTKDAKRNTDAIIKLNTELRKEIDDNNARFNNTLNALTDKLNAIIEVQSIVYSTIKDEKVRSTVNNLLVNAKYAETATRAELKKQIEDLKDQVSEKTAELAKFVEKTSNAVSAIVDGDAGKTEVDESDVIMRY